jgi:hypothetical protein
LQNSIFLEEKFGCSQHLKREKNNVAKGYQPRDPAYENKLSKLYDNAEKQQNIGIL